MENIKWLIDEYEGIKKQSKIKNSNKNLKTTSKRVEVINYTSNDNRSQNNIDPLEKMPINNKTDETKTTLQISDSGVEQGDTITINEIDIDPLEKMPVEEDKYSELCDCEDKEELKSIIDIINMDDQTQFENTLITSEQEENLTESDLSGNELVLENEEETKNLDELLLEKKQVFIDIHKKKIQVSNKPPCNCKKMKIANKNSGQAPKLNNDSVLRNIAKEDVISKSYEEEIIEIDK